MELTADQEKAYKLIREYYECKISVPYVRLFGYSGTGKTTIIDKFIAQLSNEEKDRVIFLAPTNKAKKLIKQKVKKSTLHKFLKMDRSYDSDGRLQFTFVDKEAKNLKKLYDILFIDEASMVTSKMLNDLLKLNIKIVFIGDGAQLPPVNDTNIHLFDQKYDQENVVEMSKIVRSDKSSILALSDLFRRAIFATSIDLSYSSIKKCITDDAAILYTSQDTFIDAYLRAPPKSIILCWTNNAVDNYNKLIRRLKKLPPEFIVGDGIITKTAINIYYEEEDVIIPTSTFLKIVEIKKRKHIFKFALSTIPEHIEQKLKQYEETIYKMIGKSIEVYDLYVDHYDDYNILNRDIISVPVKKELYYNIFTTIKNGMIGITRQIERIYVSQLWVAFNMTFGLLEQRLNFRYAITVHKAQGSTYSNVFVDMSNILYNSNNTEARKCLYTAVTRASKQVNLLVRKN